MMEGRLRRRRQGEDRLVVEASLDLAEQLNYISERNASAAYKIDVAIEGSVTLLLSHPELGRPNVVPGSRELLVKDKPSIVIYWIRPEEIFVGRLIHGARQRET